MFGTKFSIIIAVQHDEVCWISCDRGDDDGPFFSLPLEQLLNHDKATLPLPDWVQGKQKPLCIIPDHWFGSQSYPFRSKKRSLIKPFLERKLAAAYPGRKAIGLFYNYRYFGEGDDQKLEALFFQEDQSYQLYTALEAIQHPPLQMTAPAFLWEERLRHVDGKFNRQGTLLIHHAGNECYLYFYRRGHYQFSRIVSLSDSADDLDALGFEINQSLYMFSQKAKSDLDRIYMLCDAPHCRRKLGDLLSREIIDLKPLFEKETDTVAIREMETLNGLLQKSQLNGGTSFFSVMHRQMKQTMGWRPVQWTGIVVGLILLIGLSSEHFLLQKMLNGARSEYQTTQQRITTDASTMALSECAATLEQVLAMANQSYLTHAAHRIPSGFPAGTRLKELDFRIESPPTVKFTAWVQARNANDLQITLTRLITRIKEKFKTAQTLTLNDIDIQLNQPGGRGMPHRYRIAFQLELP